jgi:hypothetical protein
MATARNGFHQQFGGKNRGENRTLKFRDYRIIELVGTERGIAADVLFREEPAEEVQVYTSVNNAMCPDVSILIISSAVSSSLLNGFARPVGGRSDCEPKARPTFNRPHG